MNLTVFTGPDPDANLLELLNRTPLRIGPACAVTPDSRSAGELERMLAVISGSAFAGHRVFTLEGLARAVLSQAGSVPETIPGHLKRALVAEIVSRRIGSGSRYAGLAAYPGFIDLLVSFLEDVRGSDEELARGHDLEAVASVYDTHLRRLGVTDHEGWISLALEDDLVERFAGSLAGSFIVHGFYDLTGRQWRFLERLLRRAGRGAVSLVHDAARPRLFALPSLLLDRFRALGARVVEVEPRFPEGTGGVFRGFRGGVYGGESSQSDVQLHTFRSAESEAGWIAGTLRNGLAKGKWESGEIMIVSRFRPEYGGAIYNALRRNGIPVEGGFSRPLENHPVTRLVLAAVDSCIRPDDEEMLRAVRQSVFTGNPRGQREPGGGADFDGRPWNCMVEDGPPEEFVRSVRKMLDLLRVKDNLNGGGDPVRAAFEMAAYSCLLDALDSFVVFYTPLRRMMRAEEFSRLLRQFLRYISLDDTPASGRGILLADAGHARYVSRSVVFFIGLDNTAFPGRHGVFSLHGPGFAQWKREHAEMEDALLFYMAMRGARTLYLTFPGIDDENRDSTLSPYVREIRDGNAGWLPVAFHHGVAGAAWEGGASDRRGRSERLMRVVKQNAGHAEAVLARIEESDADTAALLRNSIRGITELAENRGFVLRSPRSLDAVLHDWGHERVFGVTDLEIFAACPVRFFLSRLLRLKIERETTGEMDPMDRGTVIHEILARFYRERIGKGDPAFLDAVSCRGDMRRICAEVFTGNAEVFAELHPVVMLAEKRFILSWMEAFLESETEYFRDSTFRPEFLEVDFGLRRRGMTPEEFSEPHPALRIGKDGDPVLVGGRIDRIDIDRVSEPPLLRVIDYKTGGRNASLRDLEEGRDLQIALYLRAAEEGVAPGCAIHDGGFYNLREMGLSRYRTRRGPLTGTEWDGYIDAVCGTVAQAVASIREGRFPAGDCGRSEYCDFRGLCRGGRSAPEDEGEGEANADT